MSSQQRTPALTAKGWSMLAATRLKKAVSNYGRQEDVAEAAGISRSGLAAILSGATTPREKTLLKICEVVGVEAGAILDRKLGSNGPRKAIELPEASQFPDMIAIWQFDLAYGLGPLYVDDHAPKTMGYFPREWVRAFSSSRSDQLFFARASGDSMMPTILDGDMVLIDTSQLTPRMSDQIWAVRLGDLGMIKRLRSLAGGRMMLHSDNPSIAPEEVVDNELSIAGRVVAVMRRI